MLLKFHWGSRRAPLSPPSFTSKSVNCDQRSVVGLEVEEDASWWLYGALDYFGMIWASKSGICWVLVSPQPSALALEVPEHQVIAHLGKHCYMDALIFMLF